MFTLMKIRKHLSMSITLRVGIVKTERMQETLYIRHTFPYNSIYSTSKKKNK